eukprot:5164044-Alexandrium_andersonii.AAC.1
MGTPVGAPTPTDPSQAAGVAPNASAGQAASSAGPALSAGAPPGLAPADAAAADMDGIEEVGEEDDVVLVGQP